MSRRAGSTSRALTASIAVVAVVALTHPSGVRAASVAPITMGSSANFSVLGATTVTNTNATELEQNLGLWPGTSITGFPPGVVLAPSTIENSTAVAEQAQADLTSAYLEAEGRPVDATTPADLGGLTLPGGVYAAPGKGALGLTGSLVLDGAGDPSTVFIFQTDTTLTTAAVSTVTLINGAQECNVFWQVGSSATLGANSVFSGSVMALASVTVNSGVVVHGRTLASTGAVTLDGDTFVAPTCVTATPTTTTTTLAPTTTTALAPTTTTLAPTTTTTTLAATTTTQGSPAPTTTTTTLAATTTTLGSPAPTTTTTTLAATTTTQGSPAVTTTTQHPDANEQAPKVLGDQAAATTGPTGSSRTAGNSPELPRTGGPFAPPIVIALIGGLLIAAFGAARSTPER